MNILFFIILSLIPSLTNAMESAKIFKGGPLHLINNTQHPLLIETHRIGKPDEKPQILMPREIFTIPSIRLVSNEQEAKQIAQSEGASESVYKIVIRLSVLQKTPLIFPLDLAIDKINECIQSQKTQEISALINIDAKTALGLTGWYTYYTLKKPDFFCGKYKTELEKEWQAIGPSGGIIEAINIEEIAQAPLLFTDIVALHPGWDLKKAKEFYNNLFKESDQAKETYLKNKKELSEERPQENNILKNKFNQIVEIAKKVNFLKPETKIENSRASIGISKVVFNFDDDYVYFTSQKFAKKPDAIKTLSKDYLNAIDEHTREFIAQDLVKAFKIHLMPENNWNSIEDITERLLNLLTTDVELQKIVSAFKVRLAPLIVGSESNPIIMPIIVLYIFSGKDATQIALNKIYNHFKGIPGLGLTPRYNVLINSLIYVSQGDGEEKGGTFSPYYEPPREAYYRDNITGTKQDYHLKHPETGIELK
jgi:hypothetical protein